MNIFNGFAELEISGKVLGFRFGWNSNAIFCELTGTKLSELSGKLSNPSPGDLRDFYFSAYRANCLSKEIDQELNRWQFGDLMDEMRPEDFNKLVSAITGSLPTGEDGESKKN